MHSRHMGLTANVIANFVGQGLRAVMLLAFVPLYIRILGIEAYGLIGILETLQIWLSMLDLGLRPALGREMSRFLGGGLDTNSIWALLRSVETVAVAVAILLFTGVGLAYPFLTTHLVHPHQLSYHTVGLSFVIIGFIIAMQFIETVYVSALAGLQRQVVQNIISSLVVLVRTLGSVVVLLWVSPSISAFFLWQGSVSALSAFSFAIVTRRCLPRPEIFPRFSWEALKNVRSYAGGMLAISLLSIVLTQLDKLLVATRLPLDQFGYYVLAGSVAGAMSMFATPVGAAFVPRLTELVERGDVPRLSATFHLSAQLTTLLVGSAGITLAMFGRDLLLYWTGNAHLVARTSPILAILAIGTMANALSSILYGLQMAHGWTSLTVRINTVAALLFAPAIIIAIDWGGARGAAWMWLAINAGSLVAGGIFTFTRVLPQDRMTFVSDDLTKPMLIMSAIIACFRLTLPLPSQPLLGATAIAASALAALVIGCLTCPEARAFALGAVRQIAIASRVSANRK